MKILLIAINAKYIHSNPAVFSLYSYCEDYKDNLEVVQYNINQRPEDILADIYNHRPDVIAMSCYIWNMNMVKSLIPDIKQVLPHTDIWLGGPEVSFDGDDMLNQYPEITGVMVGEGESTFRELVEYYLERSAAESATEVATESATESAMESDTEVANRGADIRNIPGIWIRSEGKPLFTSERNITDINSIPFIYEKTGLDRFKNQIIYYESSRGCPFRCSYCLSAIDKTVRLRDLDKVKKELQFFLDARVSQVKFIDRTFNCNKEHALGIWSYIHEHDNQVTNFHFEVAADILCQEEIELISRMRPGLIQLEIGVQSTNPRTIREINRRMDLDLVRRHVAQIKAFGNTHQHLDLIVGLPYEDKSSFINSFNDVHAMEPDQLQLGFLKVLKGSVMEEKCREYDLRYHSRPAYEIMSTKWISFDEVLELKKVEEMVELYYNSGQFTTTMRLLLSVFDTPFSLYESLAAFYDEKGYFINTPARSYRYEVLHEFGSRYVKNTELLAQALTCDMYLREKCKSRIGFAKDLSSWKEQLRVLNPDRKFHVEVFDYPVWEKSPEKMTERLPEAKCVIFDYDNRDPLSYNAGITVV